MTLENVLRECLEHYPPMLHDGVPYAHVIEIDQIPEFAAHLRAHGVVMRDDVIGCINKRVMDYSPLGDLIARPMNDVEIQLQLLCEDIRALKGGDDAV